MIELRRFVNELMNSNCYILWDNASHRCVVIDPASEKSTAEIEFIKENELILDYIFLTHEHTDHNWGVNSLIEAFPCAKVVCHKICAERIGEESSKYFRLYYDDASYSYVINRVDVIIEDSISTIRWNSSEITIEYTPGHSLGSICIIVGDLMFTGDTIMPFKPYINKRDGSKELYEKSIEYIHTKYANKNMIVCPGHGDQYPYT